MFESDKDSALRKDKEQCTVPRRGGQARTVVDEVVSKPAVCSQSVSGGVHYPVLNNSKSYSTLTLTVQLHG